MNTAALENPAKLLSERFREPDWLAERRAAAFEHYLQTPNPDRVAHLWRYTEPEQFEPASLERAAAPVTGQGDFIDAARAVFEADGGNTTDGAALLARGGVAHRTISAAARARGLALVDLRQAAADADGTWGGPGSGGGRRELVKEHLGAAVLASHGRFESLNAALWQAGLLIHVPRGAAIEKPIHIIISGDEETDFLATRLLAVVEENAQATIVVEYASPRATPLLANSVVELFAGANSHVRHVTIQRWGDQTVSFATQRARVERGASLLGVWAGLGAKVAKADLGTRLGGPGANTQLWGMAFAHRRQHFDQHTAHWHAAGQTSSNLDFKVVLKDKARSAYTGRIRIENAARGCEAYQENRNLLLSRGPRADSIPELEILNDDVKCTHGATIGPISAEEMFYLRARGIPRDEAARLIVSGFVEPTFREVPTDLRERLRAAVAERLKQI